MTPDELWEKYADMQHMQNLYMPKVNFLAALAEYGQAVRDRDAEDCICKVNFRQIVKEHSSLIGDTYLDRDGNKCTFFGIVWGDDDLYYGMFRQDTKTVTLLSCVGSIEGFGYERCAAAISREPLP